MPDDRPEPEKIDHRYFARFAQDAREMAERTNLTKSRDLYLTLAAEYDAKAIAAARGALADPD
jgi:hypothetical protein